MINFVVIGGGWRAEFYLRIAQALPETISISAICIRNPERASYIRKHFNVKVVSTVDDALKTSFDFVVNCINKDNITDLSVNLADMGYYVLAETPVTKTQSGTHNYDNIQIAEQFHLRGTYQAIKKVIEMGTIGDINHINISTCHDYHAMSLMRFLLDDYEKPDLLGEYDIDDDVMRTNGRSGKLKDNNKEKTTQKIKIFKFKNATVVYDYNIEQYFSPIRKDRILIRGTRGEIENDQIRYLNSKNEFVCGKINFITSGLLDGFYNDKITFEDKVLFKFPFCKARLSEEETAMAACLVKMKEYTENRNELYSYKKAYEDYSFFQRE